MSKFVWPKRHMCPTKKIQPTQNHHVSWAKKKSPSFRWTCRYKSAIYGPALIPMGMAVYVWRCGTPGEVVTHQWLTSKNWRVNRICFALKMNGWNIFFPENERLEPKDWPISLKRKIVLNQNLHFWVPAVNFQGCKLTRDPWVAGYVYMHGRSIFMIN